MPYYPLPADYHTSLDITELKILVQDRLGKQLKRNQHFGEKVTHFGEIVAKKQFYSIKAKQTAYKNNKKS